MQSLLSGSSATREAPKNNEGVDDTEKHVWHRYDLHPALISCLSLPHPIQDVYLHP